MTSASAAACRSGDVFAMTNGRGTGCGARGIRPRLQRSRNPAADLARRSPQDGHWPVRRFARFRAAQWRPPLRRQTAGRPQGRAVEDGGTDRPEQDTVKLFHGRAQSSAALHPPVTLRRGWFCALRKTPGPQTGRGHEFTNYPGPYPARFAVWRVAWHRWSCRRNRPADAERLLDRAERALDLKEIERLQRAYGYYIDHSDWDNVVDLLTEDAKAEYAVVRCLRGQGVDPCAAVCNRIRQAGLRPQQLREHTQLQPVITLSPDGRTAQGALAGAGAAGPVQGIRALAGRTVRKRIPQGKRHAGRSPSLHWYETFTVPFQGGWKGRMEMTNVADRKMPPPDRPVQRQL